MTDIDESCRLAKITKDQEHGKVLDFFFYSFIKQTDILNKPEGVQKMIHARSPI